MIRTVRASHRFRGLLLVVAPGRALDRDLQARAPSSLGHEIGGEGVAGESRAGFGAPPSGLGGPPHLTGQVGQTADVSTGQIRRHSYHAVDVDQRALLGRPSADDVLDDLVGACAQGGVHDLIIVIIGVGGPGGRVGGGLRGVGGRTLG